MTYSEIMNYYSPKWMAAVGFVASIFASFQLPMFGFVLSQYVYLLALDPHSEAFNQQRNEWTIAFALLCIGIGLSTYV